MKQLEGIEMIYRDLKNKVKQEQKILAQLIKRGKELRKPCNRTDVTKDDKQHYYVSYGDIDDGFANWKIESLSDDYRHKHIVYCTFFNKTPYEMVESNCNENPDSHRIDSIRKEWEGLIDEALRNCA